jgi:hypothetical protein
MANEYRVSGFLKEAMTTVGDPLPIRTSGYMWEVMHTPFTTPPNPYVVSSLVFEVMHNPPPAPASNPARGCTCLV